MKNQSFAYSLIEFILLIASNGVDAFKTVPKHTRALKSTYRSCRKVASAHLSSAALKSNRERDSGTNFSNLTSASRDSRAQSVNISGPGFLYRQINR